MSTAQEAPALIQYACERCKTRFVLPPSRRRLNFLGRIKATGMAFSRSIRYREGIHSTYDSSRRQLLAKLDDDAYQQFVQSFKFCHECRQFVCSECWSAARRTCLGCFAKAAGTTVKARPPFSPDGPEILRPAPMPTIAAAVAAAAPRSAAKPPKGNEFRAAAIKDKSSRTRSRRMRTDAALLVLGLAVLMFAVELVFIYPHQSGASSPSQSPSAIAAVTGTATPSQLATDTPTPFPTSSPTASPSASPSGSPSASPSATDSPSPSPSGSTTPAPTEKITPKPTPKPTPRPATPTPFPTPKIGCSPTSGTGPVTVGCSWTNKPAGSYSTSWKVSNLGNIGGGYSVGFTLENPGSYTVVLTANGKKSGGVTISVS